MWHFINKNGSIFEVTVYSYVFVNKASQSETKIENKYLQCTINISTHPHRARELARRLGASEQTETKIIFQDSADISMAHQV